MDENVKIELLSLFSYPLLLKTFLKPSRDCLDHWCAPSALLIVDANRGPL